MRIGSAITLVFLILCLALAGLGFLISENLKLRNQMKQVHQESRLLHVEQTKLRQDYQFLSAARVQLQAENETLHRQIEQLQKHVLEASAPIDQDHEEAGSPLSGLGKSLGNISGGQAGDEIIQIGNGSFLNDLRNVKSVIFLSIGLLAFATIAAIYGGIFKFRSYRITGHSSQSTYVRVLMARQELDEFVRYRREQAQSSNTLCR